MKPNIFLVTIDALRSDYIYRKDGDTHPFLSSLMKESLVFENAISPGPATAPAFPGLFTDMTHLEARKGKGKFNEIPPEATFLAERFRENGYFTAGFSNNAHLTRIQGYDKGFDHFYDGLGDEGSDEKSNKSLNLKNKIIDILENSFEFKFRRGKHVIGPLLSLINERGYERFPSMLKKIQSFLDDYSKDKPLFLWAHMMEVHSPYDLPSYHFYKLSEKKISSWERHWLRHKRHNSKGFDGKYLTQKEMEKIKILYRCGIREADSNLKSFFNYLQEKGFLEYGCFTVTADHGENLGDHGLITHSYVYNSVLKVPLLIYDGKKKGKIKEVFSNFYLGDLLLDYSEDSSIDDQINEYSGIAISERGPEIYTIQDKRYKIIWENHTDKKKYFKLKDGYEEKEIGYDEDISYLETVLKYHIKKVQDKEKEKIDRTIKNIF